MKGKDWNRQNECKPLFSINNKHFQLNIGSSSREQKLLKTYHHTI